MRTIEHVDEMQCVSLDLRRRGGRIAFVPTMGFLHEGHLSLMRAARSRAEVVVVSIFVNPTQFGPGEDVRSYPRNLERDRKLCEGERVDILFCPADGEMYQRTHSVYVEETELSHGLCGALRPGHFRGVATVVAKLFNIVQPHVAVFGQKDAQQVRIIRQMVADLNFAIEIVAAPTVREPDGLAMSSRNARLSSSERVEALCLMQSLQRAAQAYRDGERDAGKIREAMAEVIGRARQARVDYIEIVDPDTLRPLSVINGTALATLAVRIGDTRLIDNLILGPPV